MFNTKAEILAILNQPLGITEYAPGKKLSHKRFVIRALLAIYHQQTLEEQQVENTVKRNNVGFNSADANKLTRWAKWYLSKGDMGDGYVKLAAQKLKKYAGQLATIAGGEK